MSSLNSAQNKWLIDLLSIEWPQRAAPGSQGRPRRRRQGASVSGRQNWRGHEEGQHSLAHCVTRRTGGSKLQQWPMPLWSPHGREVVGSSRRTLEQAYAPKDLFTHCLWFSLKSKWQWPRHTWPPHGREVVGSSLRTLDSLNVAFEKLGC